MRNCVIAVFFIMLVVSISLHAAKSQEVNILDSSDGKLLNSVGLDHLSKEDQQRVIDLVATAIESSRKKNKRIADIADRAEKYFEAEGFKALYLKIVSVKGEDWLVVSNGLTTSATKDLPLMFPTLLFKEGYYFCKPAIMGGISEMIDDSGTKQSFPFADWKDLR